jgi:hypothetical protein
MFSEIRYIEIDSIKNAPTIEIKNIDDIEAVISNYGIRIGYLQKISSSSILYVIADSGYFSFPMKGYNKLSDYRLGETLKFKDGNDYNNSVSLGLQSSELYYYYTENSFHSVDDCKDAFKNGYENINMSNYKSSSFISPKIMPASSAYYEAKKLGYTKFSDYKEYLDFKDKGFKSKTDYQTAIAQGFKSGDDFYNASENGFTSYSEYHDANNFGIITYSDYQIFSKIIQFCEKISSEKSLDKKYSIIFYYIQNLQKGEMSLSVLANNLKSNFNNQSKELCNAINLWVSDYSGISELESQRDGRRNSYQSQKKLINFLNYISASSLSDFFEKADMSSLGNYNAKTEIFKKK